MKRDKPGVFNALNLATLQLERPAVLEEPGSCASLTTAEGYFSAWHAWYAQRGWPGENKEQRRLLHP